ncbi:hypothetical protein ACO22_04057 [Paracoccidioides brasiliensis]|uniref:Uncharacterized protein n=1 Tax=Paracoccidioides brasiliensis TaxID=121759 RepID=A0A1D2JE78_PARBR|nr:hypothetical protein ACO22_04057 [Paracoccidioides brasiliensis]ODH51645.1 hypothetical protein GX48_02110 [Paracoccidioides brasiliensis]
MYRDGREFPLKQYRETRSPKNNDVEERERKCLKPSMMFAWRRNSVQEERSEHNNQSKLDGREKEMPNAELDRRFQA